MRLRPLVLMTLLSISLALADNKSPGPKQTVGLFLNDERASQGYTLFAPVGYNTTYLINNEGLKINTWESEYYPGMSVYLSEDGYLYRSIAAGSSSRFDGIGGGVEKMDWDGNVLWRYIYCNDDVRQHHDIEVLPNGNVLMVAWEHKEFSEALEVGRDTQTIHIAGIWPDHVVEIEQTGDTTGKIVWKWHVWDHLVQEYDSTAENFGDVSENYDLVDVNYVDNPGATGWTHANTVTYNEKFDQIMISSRDFCEIWVIDHSTTIQEAAGSSGGKYGRGGDILYRWGNPAAYSRGNANDQTLFWQHDPQWIKEGIPGSGNILVFSNGNNDYSYSEVKEFTPPVDPQGNYILDGPTFGPEEAVWIYTDPDYYSDFISGVQRLPNGNTLICYGPQGEFVEVTVDGEKVWHYINPVVTIDGPLHQGEFIDPPGINAVFKIRRYPLMYPAFQGKDMTPGDPVELYPEVGVTESEKHIEVGFDAYPNPFHNTVTLNYQLPREEHVKMTIYNSLGQQVLTLADEVESAGGHQVIWDGTSNGGNSLAAGVYFISLNSETLDVRQRVVLVR